MAVSMPVPLVNILPNIFKKLFPEIHTKRGNALYSCHMNASDEINDIMNYSYAIIKSKIRKRNQCFGL